MNVEMVNLISQVLAWISWFVLLYMVGLNLFYSVVLMIAARAVTAYNKEYFLVKGAAFPKRFIKPFSILVPVYNEEATIVDSVRSFLSLDYPEYEVILCNDGSTDKTLEILKQTFRLVRVDIEPDTTYECKPIRALHFSEIEPKLVVVDKENGGKADAQNAGANMARYPYLCVVDADTLLDGDSLTKFMGEFSATPNTVALGGVVRVANGCRVEKGKVTEVRMPPRLIEQIQVVEYLRAFLFGRVGWSWMNILMIISGAFGAFRRDALARVRGWSREAIAEDMDLVVRLHRLIHANGLPWNISFVPDPVCWTQVPHTLRGLSIQRDRWQRGLMQTLVINLEMFFNPRYRGIGLVGYPYFFIFEMMSAFVEFICYPITVTCFLLGIVNLNFFILFLAVVLIWGLCISYTSIVLHEITYLRYTKRADFWRLFVAGFLENFGYRQLHSFWRLKGIVKYIFRRASRSSGGSGWKDTERKSFGRSREEEKENE